MRSPRGRRRSGTDHGKIGPVSPRPGKRGEAGYRSQTFHKARGKAPGANNAVLEGAETMRSENRKVRLCFRGWPGTLNRGAATIADTGPGARIPGGGPEVLLRSVKQYSFFVPIDVTMSSRANAPICGHFIPSRSSRPPGRRDNN